MRCPMPPARRYDLTWAMLAAFGLSMEAVALRREKYGIAQCATLSRVTRKAFRVQTRGGRVGFGVGWTGFAAWFLWHILQAPEPTPAA